MSPNPASNRGRGGRPGKHTAVFHSGARARILGIHRLSRDYNARIRRDHRAALLGLIRKHVREIEELLKEQDPHGIVETGDLAVLCLELVVEHGRSLDDVMNTCFLRYETKLKALLESQKRGRRTQSRPGTAGPVPLTTVASR